MKLTSKFVQLSAIDPEAARRLAPGVTMLVSRRTLAEILKEKQQELEDKQGGDRPLVWSPASA
jgi:hypothetical protein